MDSTHRSADTSPPAAQADAATERLLARIRNGVIGRDTALDGPFGPRRVTYADYTASGRNLSFIEEFIRDHVMPYYANTHTESSGTGLQTTRFREDARAIIHRCVGGTDDDVVIFCGTGATAAVNKVVDILNLRIPADLDRRHELSRRIPREQHPVVFVGPYEHHSNELPWRESIAEIVRIEEGADGRPDLRMLERELERAKDRPLRIGAFCAASNVTGIGSGSREISAILHRHGALAFWDFAAAAPYVQIAMHRSSDDVDDSKDAIFLSPHKLIGGPGTPGVLVIKRKLLTNTVPTVPGGGTVAFVSANGHRYITDPVHREEGGTPDILGCIRAGLAFQLKEAVGERVIEEREEAFVREAVERWSAVPNIRILGNNDARRLSILSFVIRHGERQLHPNFVVALLSDLFGVQARGGCSCAGPYGQRLLEIDAAQTDAIEQQVLRGYEGIKPGWVRVNFNYFISRSEFEYILRTVELVATRGWRLLPLYRFDPKTGRWRHREWEHRATMSLDEITYDQGAMHFDHPHEVAFEAAFETYWREAEAILETSAAASRTDRDRIATTPLPPEFEALRWFTLPEEAADELADA